MDLYLRCQTQWVYSGMAGVRTGLNYTGVEVVRRRMGVAEPVLDALQVIEQEFIDVDREKHEHVR